MNMFPKQKRGGFQPPCEACGAHCCRYVAIEIDKPTSKMAFDHIRWYLSHRDVGVFVDHDGKWHVEFRSACEYLSEDNRCKIYQSRPRICQRHGNKDEECEYFDSPYRHYFSTPEEFERFLDNRGKEWRFKGARTSSK